MRGFVVPFALLLIVLASSRLITKKDLEQIREHNAKMIHPEYSDPNFVPQPGASANPVKGIANATSGYLPVAENSTAALFYVFYQCRGLQGHQTNTSVPTIIWLQGGPGGTSMLGNFFENGPYSIIFGANGKYAEAEKSSSWNDYYNLLYIDNPKGVGYSYLGNDTYVTDEDQVAADFVNALLNFYSLSTFAGFNNSPLFIFGESYAGHYIPSISQAILQYNQANPSSAFPLKGVGIGDGWTDPINQLVNNDLFGFSLGLIDFSGKAQVEFYQAAGINNIQSQNWQAALSDFGDIMDIIASDGANLNVYNYRDFGSYNVDGIIDFMNYPDTCTRYNVNPYLCGTFVEINTNVYNALSNDFMQTVAPRVAYVVERIPVLLYNGQWDIIVNAPAAQNWINNLQWSGNKGFYNAAFNSWVLNNGTVAGFNKTYGNLHFNLVNKAGHLAPHDQLESTIEMLNSFIGKAL